MTNPYVKVSRPIHPKNIILVEHNDTYYTYTMHSSVDAIYTPISGGWTLPDSLTNPETVNLYQPIHSDLFVNAPEINTPLDIEPTIEDIEAAIAAITP